MRSQFRPISHLMSRENLKPMPMWGAVLAGLFIATALMAFVDWYTSGGTYVNGEPLSITRDDYFASIAVIHTLVWVFVAWLFRRYGNGGYVPASLKENAPHDTSMTGDPGAEPHPPRLEH